jgi:hypothetical protein
MRQGASGKRQVKERRETGLFWKKKSRDAYYGTPAKLQLKPVTQSTMHGSSLYWAAVVYNPFYVLYTASCTASFTNYFANV